MTVHGKRTELKNLPDWSYELDYVALVRILHNLLYPEQKFTIWRDIDRLTVFNHFTRSYEFRKLWPVIGDILLNPGLGSSSDGDGDGKVGVLERVKSRIWRGDEKNKCYTAVQLRHFEEALRQ